MASGSLLDNMTSTQKMLGIILLITLLTGAVAGGYATSKSNNDIKCLSCLALNPAFGGEFEWWDVYPEDSPKAGEEVPHPSLVTNSLDSYEVVMLYFWQPSCTACDAQWEAMTEDGLVTGPEDGGRMAWKSDQVKLYSINAKVDRSTFETYADYTSQDWATPMTVFIIEDNGEILWYAAMGYNPSKDLNTPEAIREILETVV